MTTIRFSRRGATAAFGCAALMALTFGGVSCGSPPSDGDDVTLQLIAQSERTLRAELLAGEVPLAIVATADPSFSIRIEDAHGALVALLPDRASARPDLFAHGSTRRAVAVAGTCFDVRCDAVPESLTCCALALRRLLTESDPSWLPGIYDGHGL